MKLRLLGFAVAFLAVVSTCAPFARADNAGVNVQTGTISGTGNLAPLNVQNDNVCNLQFTGAGTATVTAQGASDYVPTYNSIASATSQAIGAAGSLSFAIPTAFLVVRINVGTYGSTPIPYTLTCSGTSAAQAAGGGVSASITSPVAVPTSTPVAAATGVLVTTQAQCGTSGLMCNLSSTGTNTNGGARNSLNIDICNAISAVCAAPIASPNASAASSSNSAFIVANCSNNAATFNCQGVNASQQASVILPAAASPAPATVAAQGFNTAGAAAPVICTKTAGGSGTTDGNVQILALSGTTHVYVCEVDISVGGSVAGSLRLISGTGSACATPVNQGPGVEFATTGTSSIAVGTGVGIVFDGGQANELCIGGTGTSTLYIYHVMYEQF